MKAILHPGLVGTMALAMGMGGAFANVAVWTGEGPPDNMMDAANWAEGSPPGPHDQADFSAATDVPLALAGDAEFGSMRLSAAGPAGGPSDLHIDFGGYTLGLVFERTDTESGMEQASLVIPASSVGHRTLLLRNGTARMSDFYLTGSADLDPPILHLDQGAQLETTGCGWIGFLGGGEVRITNGSRWTNTAGGWGFVMVHYNGEANFTISGPDSAYIGRAENSEDGRLQVGYVSGSGTALLQVSDGASFEGEILCVGGQAFHDPFESNGSVLVEGKGSSLKVERLYIGGGVVNSGGTPAGVGKGQLTVSDGAEVEAGTLEVLSNPTAGNAGSVLVDGGILRAGMDTGAEAKVVFHPGTQLEIRAVQPGGEPPVQAGELHLEEARLLVLLDPRTTLRPGDRLPLISHFGLHGEFAGLPEGSTINAGGREFKLSYQLGGQSVIGIEVPATGAR